MSKRQRTKKVAEWCQELPRVEVDPNWWNLLHQIVARRAADSLVCPNGARCTCPKVRMSADPNNRAAHFFNPWDRHLLHGLAARIVCTSETPVCAAAINRFRHEIYEAVRYFPGMMEEYAQAETYAILLGTSKQLPTDPETVLLGLEQLRGVNKSKMSKSRRLVEERAAAHRIAVEVPRKGLRGKASLQYAMLGELGAEPVRRIMLRALNLSPEMEKAFRVVGSFIAKFLKPEELKDALRAFVDLPEVGIGLRLSKERLLAVETQLATKLRTAGFRRAWRDPQETLDALIRATAVDTMGSRARGLLALAHEVDGRIEAGTAVWLITRARSQLAIRRWLPEDESMASRLLREWWPEGFGEYLDGTSPMTADEVCFRFEVRKRGGAWERVEERLLANPKLGWRRLVKDALPGAAKLEID